MKLSKELRRIALAFGIVTATSVTVYGQLGLKCTCDLIHYTDQMDKAAQECWENALKRDTLLMNANNEIVALNKEISSKEDDIIYRDKLVRRNRRLAIGGILSSIGLGTILILNK